MTRSDHRRVERESDRPVVDCEGYTFLHARGHKGEGMNRFREEGLARLLEEGEGGADLVVA